MSAACAVIKMPINQRQVAFMGAAAPKQLQDAISINLMRNANVQLVWVEKCCHN